jgi:hypothetical protein
MVNMIISHLKRIGASYGDTFLRSIITSKFDFITVNNDVVTAPHAYSRRNSVIRVILLNENMT